MIRRNDQSLFNLISYHAPTWIGPKAKIDFTIQFRYAIFYEPFFTALQAVYSHLKSLKHDNLFLLSFNRAKPANFFYLSIASLTLNIYFHLFSVFFISYLTRITITNHTPHTYTSKTTKEPKQMSRIATASNKITRVVGAGGGGQGLMVSLILPFCAVLFPLDVLGDIWDVIESVSEGFLTYSF